jgi:ethanolamine ammonia-lyase small subunit
MSDPGWTPMRALTAARIGLQRSGASLGTLPLLEFRMAHARARDAVHHELGALPGLEALGLPVVVVRSQAADRRSYLMRPDLGRALDGSAVPALAAHAGRHDLAIVVADGLSALAVERHAEPVLAALLPALRAAGWAMAPLVVAYQARVAVGDAVARTLGAGAVLVLIGERPGLSAPDSLGAYLTWAPAPGTTDADRNCVSNIRPDRLGYQDAAWRLVFLLDRMRAIRGSGVRLKDDSARPVISSSIR